MTVRKIVAIMGGDGSLATTVKFLRSSKITNLALIKGKISFAMLPFGTGNDGAQVFGWGMTSEGELWLSNLEELMRDIITSQTESLTMWNVLVDGDVYDAHKNKVENRILLCYYFNIGLDALVGLGVERNRTSRRCCNYILYAIIGVWKLMFSKEAWIKQQVSKVVSLKVGNNGELHRKVVADIDKIQSCPFNMVGLNLKQAFGGLCKPGTWKQSKTKLMDPNKAMRRQGLAIVETSCDENESSLEQKIDDDKMELMCHEKLQDYVDFELSRYGQVRSPF